MVLSAEKELEQLERLLSEDTPAASWLPIPLSHIGSQVKRRQSQSYKFKEFAKSCLIRCANMKWIRWVLLKIQSGHDSVHRRTDGQRETSIPPFQLRWGWVGIIIHHTNHSGTQWFLEQLGNFLQNIIGTLLQNVVGCRDDNFVRNWFSVINTKLWILVPWCLTHEAEWRICVCKSNHHSFR